MFLLQSFEQLLQTGVECGVPARDLNRTGINSKVVYA
jgi:hypothetical protein